LSVGVGVVAAAATGTSGPRPAAKPLARALHDALGAPAPAGVTARIKFTNRLLPTDALSGQVGSALMSGASGRLWARNDGRGRLELQSDAGDVQIVWTQTTMSVFDASSNTVYRATLPERSESHPKRAAAVPAVAQIQSFLAKLGEHVAISAAAPTNIGGRPAYAVRLAPKQHPGLLRDLELAWDAARAVPLRVAIHGKGASSAPLALSVTHIGYGRVPAADVDIAPPSDAKVVDLGGLASGPGRKHSKPVTGLTAVHKAAPFAVVAPPRLAGRALRDIRLTGKAVVAVYGEALDSIVVVERQAAASGAGAMSALPAVHLGGISAHELTTALGTVLTWKRDGVGFVVAGSVTSATAEAAARELG
jgi:hypothetical protein